MCVSQMRRLKYDARTTQPYDIESNFSLGQLITSKTAWLLGESISSSMIESDIYENEISLS